VFTTSLFLENFNLIASTRFSLIFYSRTSHSTCFPTARYDSLKRQSHPQPRLNYYNHLFLNETIPKERKSIWSWWQLSVVGKNTTLLILAGKGRIPLLMESQQVFRKSLVTLKRYLIFHSILETLDLMQLLFHTCHTLCYCYYKPGDKTCMRKGPDCDYEKRNTSVAC
jgi:hypothetical protein